MAKYLDIADVIEGRILDYTYNDATSPIPPELTLAEQFNVSRQTIRNALKHLEKKHLVYSVQGSGTFIAKDFFAAEQRSKNVAVIMTSIEKYMHPAKSAAIHRHLAQEGYLATIFSTEDRLDYEARILDNLLGSNYAGIIMETTRSTLPRFDEKTFEILRHRLPFLLIDHSYPDVNLPSITLDYFTGGMIACEHLIHNGHQKIFFVGRSDNGQDIMRFRGYLEAIRQYRLSYSDDYAFWYDARSFRKSFAETSAHLIQNLSDCSAILLYSDELAERLLPLIKEKGIRIPEDLSVVSFDDSLFASEFTPKLTSVRYPLEALCKRAAESLVRMIKDPHYDANYRFVPELIERDSVQTIGSYEERRFDRESKRRIS